MQKYMVQIPRYRVIPSETGIGWVALQRFDEEMGKYRHAGDFRSESSALEYADNWEARQELHEADNMLDCLVLPDDISAARADMIICKYLYRHHSQVLARAFARAKGISQNYFDNI